MSGEEGLFVVCRHVRGGWKVWPLERVLKLNLQRMLHGVPLDEEWRPLAVERTEGAAMERMLEIKRAVRGVEGGQGGLGEAEAGER